MKLLYVVNGLGFSKNMPIGGADKRVAEIGKRLASQGVEVFVLTTEEGARLMKEEGLPATFLLTKEPAFWPSPWHASLLGRIFSYLYLTFSNYRQALMSGPYDVIYSSSDFFFDLLPALRLRRSFAGTRLVAISHHHLGSPWRRQVRFWRHLVLFLVQRVDFFILRFFDLILVPANNEGNQIKTILRTFFVSRAKIKTFTNGVDFVGLNQLPAVPVTHEAVFLGGFRPSKGLFDLPVIWQTVTAAIPEAKLLVLGGGSVDYQEELKQRIVESGLFEKIVLAGVLPRRTLFERLKSGRLFVSPSYEEGWGIALLEALACGLPAVIYDLPAYDQIDQGVIKVAIGDRNSFAREVVRLLQNQGLYQRKQEEARRLAARFDWSSSFEREYSEILSLVESKQ